ncbi:SDR family NAD(P)-dependent oxidoreductase [Nannocystis pusilla]|uniref:SDR family NAD(P)-dependent oxidoreductase n=1 Tax=Nannocystis pusilla TaxID=889268 RepID=A0A9X3EXB7_9BACT|nr:SDR family oxidoreductase [Nannocystis pusilla]MCY1011917.1 SDR family NAD(P)-dependent oxidoreductase [Nannocystis pusilla]
MLSLAGLHVLVTGGSRGIGAVVCRRFAAAGAVVLVHYRDRHDVAESFLNELRAVNDASHLRFAADLADPTQVDAMFEHVAREWGRLDCLVNNAGVWEADELSRFDVDVYRRTPWTSTSSAPSSPSPAPCRCCACPKGHPSSTSPPPPASAARPTTAPTRPPRAH